MKILRTVIYADILIVVNIIVNYLLLRASSAVIGFDFKAWRFLLSSAMGGAFSLIIFVDGIPTAASAAIKLAFLALMVFVAFGAKSIKAYAKACAAFFLTNFVFAGIMLAICTFVSPNAAIYKNGVVYFDIDILTLTITAIACYLILSLIARFTRSKIPQKSVYSVRITYDGKEAEGKALFDSGNSLCDCFSGRPVIIAEKDFLSPLCCSEISEMRGFRLIPFSTIKDGGVLPAFMADKAEILIDGKWVGTEKVYIAATEKRIVSGSYSALIGTPFFDAVGNKIKSGSAAEGRKSSYEISSHRKS